MVAAHQLKILHVEDNAKDALLLKESLRGSLDSTIIFNVSHVSDLASAIDVLRQENYSAVLLDLNLPDGYGIDTLKSFKQHYPEIPIIVMTGDHSEGQGIAALREGAQEYMLKDNMNSAVLRQIIQSSILRKKFENELYRKAHYDDLTGLPNKLSFEDIAQTMLERARRWNRREALLFVDLDKFKAINDTYGHDAGNFVLQETSKRMRSVLRNSDVLARYAGDEFVIYMDSDGNSPLEDEHCVLAAQKIVKAVSAPYIYESQKMHIGCSLGIAIYPDAGQTYADLMKTADTAMYKAKNDPNKNIWIILKEEDSNARSQTTH